MNRTGRRLCLLVTAVWLLAGACAPAPPGATLGAGPSAQSSPKRITAAILGNPPFLYQKLNSSNTIRGLDTLEELVNGKLAHFDNRGALQPQLAEATPTLENGLWRVFPDGTMETTWTIRANTKWHDGQDLTAGDAVFTTEVARDRELPVFRDIAYNSVESVEALDSRTITVRWKQPYIEADRLFIIPALPRHILAKPYSDDKATFTSLPYWGTEFVGTGPFKLREWELGSHVVLEANDRYVLGRPKIDEIEVKFIPDPNTLMANIAAGAVELTLGQSLSVEQAIQIRDQWTAGRMDTAPASTVVLFPQFLNPRPAIVADLQFRRALIHALDRQQIADAMQWGLSPVAHTFVQPNQTEYAEIEASVVKYDYDPRRASQLIEALGYTRGTDGTFQSRPDERLTVTIQVTTTDLNQKSMFAVADYWQRVGVAVEPDIVPLQRATDLEYRANFASFALQGGLGNLGDVGDLHSSQTRLPENNYRGRNNSRYRNPELDSLIDRFLVTIPRGERMAVARQIIHHMTDQVTMMGLFYKTEATMISHRLGNVSSAALGGTVAWNAHEWDVR